MAQKRGVIEIRLDRRQAFYAVVGSLLIISVAFVVGLIMGQRMQLIEGVGPAQPGAAEPAEPMTALAATEPQADPDYTFYEALREEPPRPLLMPSRGGIGEPATAVRLLDRQPPTSADEAPGDDATEPPEPEAAPEPEPTPAPPAEPAPEPLQVAAAEPPPAPPRQAPGARRLQRRAVASAEPEPSALDESGFFTVEAGRFPAFAEASSRRNELRAQGHDAIVTIVAPADGPREYRVQIGSYTRRADADEVAASIGLLGFRAHVIREG